MDCGREFYILAFSLAAGFLFLGGKALERIRLSKGNYQWLSSCGNNPKSPREMGRPRSTIEEDGKCQLYKELYFKLHHLEKHAEILPQAKCLLLSFFSEALQVERTENGILSLDSYSPDGLDEFVQTELNGVTRQWREYLARRQAGQSREMFQSASDARSWLVQNSPVRFVDGAWLGHIHKVTTPFADRRVTKGAWQVLSEELGDGDLAKNHAFIYSQLLQQIGANVPAADSEAFILHEGMNDDRIWRSALTQLLISLFPHDFLPEILGFNMHFEMLTLETMVTAMELREVGFDPYYFTLHITIDNAHSGHTAMSSHIVKEYIRSIASRQGSGVAHRIWKRVQAGFVLSRNIKHNEAAKATSSPFAADVLTIFQAKVAVSSGIHEQCPVRFGGRSLSAWLDIKALSQLGWQKDFLRLLSDAKPWVYKGNSGQSRLIHKLSRGGSMFGAFTDREVAVIRDWIDSLAPSGAEPYMSFTGRAETDETPARVLEPRAKYPVFIPVVFDPVDALQIPDTYKTIDTSKLLITKLLPLWFAHPCLLECFISVPWMAASPMGCSIVRILRSQHGFLPEPVGVDGMDEMSRVDHVDLMDIGIQMLSRVESPWSPPKTLDEVLERWPSPFAEVMLAAAMKPREHEWVLLGLCQAFTHLHILLAASEILPSHAQQALARIADREQENLSICVEGIQKSDCRYIDFCKGYALGKREIESCFSGPSRTFR